MSIKFEMSEDAVYRKSGEIISPEREQDIKIHKQIGALPSRTVMAFELMIQFVNRCIAEGKDPVPFRECAVRIATGCKGAKV